MDFVFLSAEGVGTHRRGLTTLPSLCPPLSCRMIADVDTNSPREVFFRVAAEMFADGNFNWGRVVALFYFASKLVLKVGSCSVVGLEVCPSQVCEAQGVEVAVY